MSETMTIKVVGHMPTRAKDGDAGYDLVSPSARDLYPREPVTIMTDTAIEIPNGSIVALVLPRSSMNRDGIHCAVGVIDSGYRGRIGVILTNLGFESRTVKAGAKIAQLVFLPVMHFPMELVTALSPSERGEGGFGSSGV